MIRKMRVSVEMIPTQRNSSIGLHNRLGLITAKSQGWDNIFWQDYISPQNIFFLCDDDINGDGYRMDIERRTIGIIDDDVFCTQRKDMFKKVIASTDFDLSSRGFCKIPETFIEEYISCQGNISEVWIEYDDDKQKIVSFDTKTKFDKETLKAAFEAGAYLGTGFQSISFEDWFEKLKETF